LTKLDKYVKHHKGTAMPRGLEDIKKTLARITRGDSVLDLLMEFERTIDATEVFSYKNWFAGELVDGPHITRYWFTTSWMYPHKLMPDPEGALRLEKIGCKVSYTKDILNQPRRVLSPKDWADQKTKAAIIEELPIWIVTISMPIKYVVGRLDALHDYLDDEYSTEESDEVAASINDEMSPPADEMGGDEFADDELGGGNIQ
jgi:hypothetical protein